METAQNRTSEAILTYLQRSIQLVSGEFSNSGGETSITDGSPSLELLLDGLERVFEHGRTEELFGTTTYWDFFSGLSSLSWLSESINWIEKDITDPDARGRAFLRYCLNRKTLIDVFLAFAQSGKIEEYYEDYAVFRQPDDYQIFVQQLRALRVIDFKLSLNLNDCRVVDHPINATKAKKKNTKSQMPEKQLQQ